MFKEYKLIIAEFMFNFHVIYLSTKSGSQYAAAEFLKARCMRSSF